MTKQQSRPPARRPTDELTRLTDEEEARLRQLLQDRFGGDVVLSGADLAVDGGTVGELHHGTLILEPAVIWDYGPDDADLDHLDHPRMTELVESVERRFVDAGLQSAGDFRFEDSSDAPPAVFLKMEHAYSTLVEAVDLIEAARAIGFSHLVEGSAGAEGVD